MSILEYIQKGGVIMYILLALNTFGFAIVIMKYFQFRMQRSNLKINANDIIKNILSKTDIPPTQDVMLELVKDKSYIYVHTLEKGMSSIKMIASISPLLGLLGTVVGILSAFEIIATQGMKNPNAFASGIALALITTVGGLIVSIPRLL
jgi:biopolymer transport protein ExbB